MLLQQPNMLSIPLAKTARLSLPLSRALGASRSSRSIVQLPDKLALAALVCVRCVCEWRRAVLQSAAQLDLKILIGVGSGSSKARVFLRLASLLILLAC